MRLWGKNLDDVRRVRLEVWRWGSVSELGVDTAREAEREARRREKEDGMEEWTGTRDGR